MGKQVFILNSKSGSAGVAKIIKNGEKSTLSLQLNKPVPGKKKCYISCGDIIIELGVVNSKNSSFEIFNQRPVDGVFVSSGKEELPYLWSGDKPNKTEAVSTEPLNEQPPDFFTFENFFGGGFEWHRIRGNFIMYDYSIIHHILSAKKVYAAINRAGYYCAGIREDEDLTLIAISIPLIKGIENPFSSLSADSYVIKSGKVSFDTLCTGIDKTGEFFISI